ncbi:hypothetical protein ADEAN_000625400 [Angomonas deanei]|uniref:Uncharacterized protein n=1 Tax=Angomonas deanei TaxID=59799 RepID=A0A7G2CII1_9TRYP|nr:hypothetical protein ADEAN_000625400 [Angomonas deanei]
MTDEIITGGVLTAVIIILIFAGVFLLLLVLEVIPLLQERFRRLRALRDEKAAQPETPQDSASHTSQEMVKKVQGEGVCVAIQEERSSLEDELAPERPTEAA